MDTDFVLAFLGALCICLVVAFLAYQAVILFALFCRHVMSRKLATGGTISKPAPSAGPAVECFVTDISPLRSTTRMHQRTGEAQPIGLLARNVVNSTPRTYEDRCRSAASYLRQEAHKLRMDAARCEREADQFEAEANLAQGSL